MTYEQIQVSKSNKVFISFLDAGEKDSEAATTYQRDTGVDAMKADLVSKQAACALIMAIRFAKANRRKRN